MEPIIWYALAAGFLLGFIVGVIVLAGLVQHSDNKRNKEVQFKQEALRPKPTRTQSVDALSETDRPIARQSKGKMYPRRGKKRS